MIQSVSNLFDRARLTGWVTGVLGAFLVVAFLVWVMHSWVPKVEVAAVRAQERVTFLTEVREADAALLTEYAWQDRERGFVRLPLDRALEIALEEWQDPVSARALLITRVEEATAPPPEPENIYE